jgi:hypothetical protein
VSSLAFLQISHTEFYFFLGGMGEVESHDTKAASDEILQNWELFRGRSNGCHDFGELRLPGSSDGWFDGFR